MPRKKEVFKNQDLETTSSLEVESNTGQDTSSDAQTGPDGSDPVLLPAGELPDETIPVEVSSVGEDPIQPPAEAAEESEDIEPVPETDVSGSSPPISDDPLPAGNTVFTGSELEPVLPAPQQETVPSEEAPKPRRRQRKAAAAETETEPEAPKPSPIRRRRTEEPAPASRILSIDEEAKVQSAEDKQAYLWMELRGSMRTKRTLTGILSGVERTPSGLPLAIVYYKDTRVVIPASEMNINLEDHQESGEKELRNRYAQILSWMMGAEIEFIVSGLDKRSGSVVASRRDAMQRKQRQFFLTPGRDGQPLVKEGTTAEARVIAVSERVVRVEIFGVEVPIFARDVAWEWVDDCNDYYGIGDRVLVKILSIDRSNPRNIRLQASIRETIPNPARDNIKKCVVQGKYIGKVSDVDRNAIYVRLNVGVNAVALAVHDRRTPSRKDDVSFVVTKIDEEAGIAIGIITRIIKQYL